MEKMKYICLAYNPLTLCKAMAYADNCWGRENTVIVFVSGVTDLPEKAGALYHCIPLQYQEAKGKSKIGNAVNLALAEKKNTVRTLKAIKEAAGTAGGEITFVVFKDNQIREATCIEDLRKRYGQRIHITLIEEGAGLYSMQKEKCRDFLPRALMYLLLGISVYPLRRFPQGLHRELDTVICEKPSVFLKKAEAYHSSAEVLKQIDVFSQENSRLFIRLFQKQENIENRNVKFVFLTQPWEHLEKSVTKEAYLCFLTELFGTVTRHGSIMIKKHPCDSFDYSSFVSEKVISDRALGNLPFEAVYEALERPVLLTLFSSAAACAKGKTSYFLYPVLKGLTCSIKQEYYTENNIQVCNTLGELSEKL